MLIISLLLPVYVKAETKEKIVWEESWEITSPANVATPNYEFVEASWAKVQADEALQIPEKPRYATHKSCVEIAKEYLGIYGTWGNGSRLLSLNSGPVVNAVVVFRYVHTGVVLAVSNGQILLYEGNYDYRGSIRTRWMSATDPTIHGYHLFN